MTTTPLDLALLHRLLGVPEHEGTYRLVRRAHHVSDTLSQLVVSLAVAEGAEAGSGSRDELRRARARAARYAELHAAVAASVAVRVVKGPSLAGHYPPGAVRPVGDLDLVVTGEAQLWQVARILCEQGGEVAELTLLRHDERTHTVLAVRWPSPDPLMDEDLRVELSTAAFTGDLGAVPVRPELPADPLLADLLSVAEERFQRDFHGKDAVDLLVLLSTGQLDTKAVVAAAEAFHLAPELSALVELLSVNADHPQLEPLTAALAVPAAAETTRRDDFRPDGQQPKGVVARLAASLPVWGMPLSTQPRDQEQSRLQEYAGALVARTPLGDFLLAAGELVDPDQYAAVLAALADEEAP